MAQQGKKPHIALEDRPDWVQRLVRARNKAGLTQAQLSVLLGVPQTTLAGYESGAAKPDLSYIRAVAEKTGVTPAWIAFGEGAPTSHDSLIGALIERYQDDEVFVSAFFQTTAMLSGEGVHPDLHAALRIAIRIAEQAKRGPDHLSVGERIHAAVAAERAELRSEITAALKKRT